MKKKVEITIALDENDQVQLSTTSKNLVTNLGMVHVAAEILKSICGGGPEPIEESAIIKPNGNKRF